MTEQNRVSAAMIEQDVTEVRAKIAELRAKLSFLISLTPQETKEIAKLGDKSVGFDEKCKVYMGTNPEFMPGFVDVGELHKDRTLRGQIMRFAPEMRALAEMVEDTLTALGSEIVMVDFAYYQNVREAARRGVPGAQSIYDDLRARFPGPGRAAKPKPE